MSRIMSTIVGIAAVMVIMGFSVSLAQWPDDPSANLLLSNRSGEQTITKVVPARDNGCYVSWWDNTSGNYDFYLQKLDVDGVIQWAQNGLLISNHPQETYLTDYDLAVDSAGYAIIALNDLRAGGDWDIYGYRISPLGEFAWGANGLTISDNTGFEPDPRVIVTAVGNIVFAWQEDNVIHARKVTPEGTDFWSPGTKTLSSTYALSIPRIAPADSDSFILQFLDQQGPYYYNPKFLIAHKYDAAGTELWGASGVLVSNAGGFGLQMRPTITSDGAGGAFSYWYDARDNTLHAFAQHIRSNGTMDWTTNGVVVSTTSGQLQRSADLVYHPATGDVMMFYENTNSDQTLVGIYGQKINSGGTRQWGSGGRAIVAMNSQTRMLINISPIGNDAIITYLETPLGDYVHTYLKAIRVATSGSLVWPSPVQMTTTLAVQGYLQSCINGVGQVISVWQDKRNDPDGDAYLQNINADGTLGPLPVRIGFIQGFVFGMDGTSPLDHVSVGLYDSLNILATTTTNLHGIYNFTIPEGIYYEAFSRSGFHDTTLSNIIVITDSTTHLTLNMRENICDYVIGDVNGNGVSNGIDVSYAVGYFKGGALPPIFCYCPPHGYLYVAGDVNGSCTFNGLDITFMCNYYLGGDPFEYCPDCPPLTPRR
jgi:hypothetical protein